MKAKKTPELIAKARAMENSGMTCRDIAPLLGVSHTSVRRWLDEGYRRRQIASATAYVYASRAAAKAEKAERRAKLARFARSPLPTPSPAE